MRILIGTGLNFGPAEYQNIGDIAMLQVAVTRLAELWPDSEILVLTDSVTDLAGFCPSAQPLSRYGAETWINDNILLGPIHQILPASFSPRLRSMKQSLKHQAAGLLEGLLHARLRLRDSSGRLPRLQAFLKALRSCDLLVICGAGGFADSCRDWNLYTLGLIDAALSHGVRVALFGQGIGPLSDLDALSRMRQVLPRVTMLSSRGTEGAETIAKQIGVPNRAFMTTGDEAVEPAYEARSPVPGNSIGVNLRIAPYSGVSDSQAEAIGTVLRDLALQKKTGLVPLPIALHSCADDRQSINRLLGGSSASNFQFTPDSPQNLYYMVARCRMVVTGAYHAAVFALAQGIPAICLSASDYYAAKFNGLRALFGEGCTVFSLEEAHLVERLTYSIGVSWDRAERLRPALLQAACSQIRSSREAYRRVRSTFPAATPGITSEYSALSIP
jgi:colanic acid/amylovoran biosynthesis protein